MNEQDPTGTPPAQPDQPNVEQPTVSQPPAAVPPPAAPGTPPSWGAPTGAPPAGAPPIGSTQPPVQWAAPAPPSPVRGRRSGMAAAAGIIMLVLGILGGLLGLLVVAGGAFLGQLGNDILSGVPNVPQGTGGAVGAFVAVLGIIIVVYSLGYILSGIGVLGTHEWARILGIVLAILSGLIWLGAVVSPGSSGGELFAVILLLAHAYVIWALGFRWRAVPA
jgi:hypothetical protein